MQCELTFERSTRERFTAFHEANPHIYETLVSLARRARAAGRHHLGIRMLWERMRWDLEVETQRPPGAPKLNDHYPPFYARLIMRQEPDLDGFFETRGGS